MESETKNSFKAKIYKVGINPCVKVPLRITQQMVPAKGYIPVKGTIQGFEFFQTLVSVKNEGFRLYVNAIMLKGSGMKLGDTAAFTLQQTAPRTTADLPMPKALLSGLKEEKLLSFFQELTPYRQKEILKYLNYLKTDEARNRNIQKVLKDLREKKGTP